MNTPAARAGSYPTSRDTMATTANSDVYDPPLSFYNSSLDDDLSDMVLAGHLHAGADVRIADRTWLGLKNDLLDAGRYRDPRQIRPTRR